MKNKLIVFLMLISGIIFAAPAGKIISETIELAAKKSGRTLTVASRKATSEMLETAVKKYGDDIYDIVKKGGLETLEQGSKHSDDFWKLCSKNHKFIPVLTKNADELLPLAKRIGPEVLEFELKSPGMTSKVVSEFGDDAIKKLLTTPKKDLVELVGYSLKADSPATKKKLFDAYLANGSKCLKELGKHKGLILTGGLTASMLIGVDNITEGIGEGAREGTKAAAEKAPGLFHASKVLCVAIIAGVVVVLLWPVRKLISSLIKNKE